MNASAFRPKDLLNDLFTIQRPMYPRPHLRTRARQPVRQYVTRHAMNIIVVASQKGGAGKTTLLRSLAVAMQQMGESTAILDTDPQGSLTSWWNRRQEESPALVKIDPNDFAAGVARLQAAGIEHLFVDTPPSVHPQFTKLLAQAKPRTRLQMQAVLALAKHGKLAPTVIHDRTDFPTAAITGRTVTEMEQEGPSAAEVRDVLAYVLTQLRKPASTHAMKKVANG